MELAPRPAAAASRLRRGVSWPLITAAAIGVLSVAPVSAGQGGYFPSAWGWLGMGACWVAALALVLRRELVVSRLELAAYGGAAALAAWTSASLLWTSSTTLSVLDAERTLAYVAVFAAALLVCRRHSALALLSGVWAAITLIALYALATHLLPERFGVYIDRTQSGRLFQPIGYWNALGILCAMGIMLAVGLADRRGSVALRVVAGSSIPVLAATTYFTFSRGAWLAAGLALCWVFVLAPGRLRYATTALIAAPFPTVAVAYAARLGPLVSSQATPAQIEGPGGRAALVIAAATASQAALLVGFMYAQERFRPSSSLRRAYAAALMAGALIALAGLLTITGSPRGTVHRLERQLTAKPVEHADLNSRLLSVSLSDRQYLWRVALHDYREHPLVGRGAGTFATYWLQHRPVPDFVVNAHDLYLETLAELGIVGLAALSLFLVPPLIAGVRARQSPLVPAALGAYTAFLIHAVVDWDWEVPAVTLAALIAAAVLLVQARAAAPVRLGVRLRWATGGCLAAVAALCGLGLAGNHALSAGATDLGNHRYQAALTASRDARRYAPWSDQPYIVAGRAELDLHKPAAALRSFQTAVRKDPSDWVAWQWLARASAGPTRAGAMRRLLDLDPRYDVVNGRP